MQAIVDLIDVEDPIATMVAAVEDFRRECLPFRAREEAFTGWLAHFMMKYFGVRRTIIESHHDGYGLASLLKPRLLSHCPQRVRDSLDTKRAWNWDIAIARSDSIDARTFQTRNRNWRAATDTDRCRIAAECLANDYVLLVELKLFNGPKCLEGIAADALKLASAAHAASRLGGSYTPPATALIVVAPSEADAPRSHSEFFKCVCHRATGALSNCSGVRLPEMFLVTPKSVYTYPLKIE